MSVNRTNLYVLFIAYTCVFIYAVFMQAGTKHITPENIGSLVNVIPLTHTFHDVEQLLEQGVSIRKNMNLVANIIGNIVLFMPLPFFLTRLFSLRNKIYVLLYAAVLSIWVEAMQYLFLLGVTDIDDVILNVLGTWIGIKILPAHLFTAKGRDG